MRRAPHEPDREVAPHDAVAVVEAIAEELRLADWRLVAADAPGFHPVAHRCGHGRRRARGVVGEIAPEVVAALDLPAPAVGFELDVDGAAAPAARAARATPPVSRFPASTIDLAFVVDDAVPAGEVLATLRDAAGDLAERIELFDVFRSDAIGAGRVSLAFTVSFRAPERTLTDDEVAGCRQELIDTVVARARRRAARVSDARSGTASACGTRRSTVRASCSTRTGSRTSTTRVRASWSRSASAPTSGCRSST